MDHRESELEALQHTRDVGSLQSEYSAWINDVFLAVTHAPLFLVANSIKQKSQRSRPYRNKAGARCKRRVQCR